MNGRIITIAQHKGGAGKTTLSTQLAAALVQQNSKVMLLDVDPQGSSTEWFKTRENALGAKNIIRHSQLQGWRLLRDLKNLALEYDYVIVDTPPHAESEASVAIRLADLVLVPIQPSPLDIWACAPTLKLILQEKKNLMIVLNRVPPRSKLNAPIMEKLEAMGIPVARTALGNRIGYASSIMMGLGVVEYDPKGAAALEMKALTEEIIARSSHARAAA